MELDPSSVLKNIFNKNYVYELLFAISTKLIATLGNFLQYNDSIFFHQTLGSFRSSKKKVIPLFFMNLHNSFKGLPIFYGVISIKRNLKGIGSVEWAEILLRNYLNEYRSIPVVSGVINII